MRITEIHIYGYGKLENLHLNGIQDLQVFYGENEAGKSTIMSFIHSILFGFPTKQQSELRYEPKAGGKYGGRLTVVFPVKGKTVIERVKGKAVGDVRVLFEDGTLGDENSLNELLYHVDKSLFQSIFSFDIHGLQNVQNMKGEDLGRYLFSAGTLGTDRLLSAENVLQKELENRFKPNGKKPLINEKLRELKELYQNLKKAEQHNEQYWSLQQEKEALEKEIQVNQTNQLAYQTRITHLKEWKELQPLIQEEKALQDEAKRFAEIELPIDGISRLDRLEGIITPLEGRRKSLEARLSSLRLDLEENEPRLDLLQKESEMNATIEKLPLLEKMKLEENELTTQLQQIDQEIAVLGEKLHLPLVEAEIRTIDTSVFMKEKIAEAQEHGRRIRAKKHDLDDRFNEEKQSLEQIEKKITNLEAQLLPKTERVALEGKVDLADQQQFLEKELIDTQERRSLLKKTQKIEQQKEAKKSKMDQVQLTIFSLLFAIMIVWGVWSTSWYLAIAGFIGIAFTIYSFYTKKAHQHDDLLNEEIEALSKQEALIIEKLKQSKFANVFEAKRLLEQDRVIAEELKLRQIQWKQMDEQYEKVLQSYEDWGIESSNHQKKLISLGKELGLPKEIALVSLADAYALIDQLKTLYRQLQYTNDKKKAVRSGIEEIHAAMYHLHSVFLERNQVSIQETAYLLREALKGENEKQIKRNEKMAKLVEMEEEYEQVRIELAHAEDELEKLLNLSQVETTEHFREIGKKAVIKAEIADKIKLLQRQIKRSSLTVDMMDQLMAVPFSDSLLNRVEGELKVCEDSLPILQNSLAEKKYEIGLIEEGGTYAELLHKYKSMKGELAEEAKEWAKFAMAKDILARTIEGFKNERLPIMLEKAEAFLSLLTDGNYVRIHQKEEGNGFLIESKHQTLFDANELSQATAEQIYVSFRLSLAITVYAKYSFPIIIDDSFVNFDHKRTERVISLLKTLTDRQVLFFTCHNHLLNHFSEEQIIFVNREKDLPVKI